jgi:hypothetical protein
MRIEKYSFGVGDRFSKEGEAQLQAVKQINDQGVEVVPVWNKSYREHKIIHTTHASVLNEARSAVAKIGWLKNYYIDADHIGMETVDEFMEYSNFFTIDVAHFISKICDEESKTEFIKRQSGYLGKLSIPGIKEHFHVSREYLTATADKYLLAIHEVSKIYNYIVSKKGQDNFIAEVSMDETDSAQTPIDLFFILSELKYNGVNIQTIAPKFTGLFAKGIDYIGNLDQFAREFEQDIAVVKYAIEILGLPESLKLSVHSGSDKFSIYPAIKASLNKFNAGIHIKTAGTTWLEEVIGLARGGGRGLDIAKQVYAKALDRYDELTGPYSNVLSIQKNRLPDVRQVNSWSSEQYVMTLTHDQKCKEYNPDFRQLIHVGYKIAVEMGDIFISALDEYRSIIAEQVKYNIMEKHLKPIFL